VTTQQRTLWQIALAASLLSWSAGPAAADGFEAFVVVSETELQTMNGREDTSEKPVIVQESSLEITLSGNTVGDGVSSGAIAVNGSAFADAHGIQSTMINSGHNVSMSSLINVVVSLPSAP
jgi:hypothetical protein